MFLEWFTSDNGFMKALLIGSFLLQAVSLCSIARRRRLSCPWLAWFPIASGWVLGNLSDDYQKKVRKKIRHKRRVLPALEGAIAFTLLASEKILDWLLGFWARHITVAICATQLLVLLLLWQIYRLRCLYDVYESCSPDSSVAFLIWSAVIPLLIPFFLLADRKSSFGMHRREAPYAIPVYRPETPQENQELPTEESVPGQETSEEEPAPEQGTATEESVPERESATEVPVPEMEQPEREEMQDKPSEEESDVISES